MDRPLPRISDSEWEIMKVLWQRQPLTAGEIVKALEGSKDWNPKTIRTLIHRLVDKEAVGVDSSGGSYRYSPLVQEEACIRSETSSFLKRIYGGALKPMLAGFLSDEKLTKEDIEELRAILERRGD